MKWPDSCLTKRVRNWATVAAGTGVAITLLAGCNMFHRVAPIAINGGPKLYAISSESAPFYRHGPQQGNGPDMTLPRNTIVKLIRPSFGYSKVELVEDKKEGYVATDDIRVAPASLVEAATATPPPIAAASTTTAGEQFDLNSTDPRLNAPPEQLPSPDLPPASDLPPENSPPGQ